MLIAGQTSQTYPILKAAFPWANWPRHAWTLPLWNWIENVQHADGWRGKNDQQTELTWLQKLHLLQPLLLSLQSSKPVTQNFTELSYKTTTESGIPTARVIWLSQRDHQHIPNAVECHNIASPLVQIIVDANYIMSSFHKFPPHPSSCHTPAQKVRGANPEWVLEGQKWVDEGRQGEDKEILKICKEQWEVSTVGGCGTRSLAALTWVGCTQTRLAIFFSFQNWLPRLSHFPLYFC